MKIDLKIIIGLVIISLLISFFLTNFNFVQGFLLSIPTFFFVLIIYLIASIIKEWKELKEKEEEKISKRLKDNLIISALGNCSKSMRGKPLIFSGSRGLQAVEFGKIFGFGEIIDETQKDIDKRKYNYAVFCKEYSIIFDFFPLLSPKYDIIIYKDEDLLEKEMINSLRLRVNSLNYILGLFWVNKLEETFKGKIEVIQPQLYATMLMDAYDNMGEMIDQVKSVNPAINLLKELKTSSINTVEGNNLVRTM